MAGADRRAAQGGPVLATTPSCGVRGPHHDGAGTNFLAHGVQDLYPSEFLGVQHGLGTDTDLPDPDRGECRHGLIGGVGWVRCRSGSAAAGPSC